MSLKDSNMNNPMHASEAQLGGKAIDMTKKERVQKALAHQNTDFVPYNIELTNGAMKRFTEKYGVSKADFFGFAGNHIEKIGYNGGETIKPGYFKDEFGVVWNRSGGDDIGVVEEYLLPEADLEGFKFPVINTADMALRTDMVLGNGIDSFKLAKIGMLLFERAWSLRGMENLLMDFYINEAFTEELFSKITDYNLTIINEAVNYPVDGFYFGDDYGQQNGLIMGPDLWRQFIKPQLKRTFAPIKEKGLPVCLHSCGNISDILEDLIEIGLDCYQTVQPEIYDLHGLKEKFGHHLSFYGAISTQQFLPFATPDEVTAKLHETIHILGKNGGYICAPTHQIPDDVPPENIMAMVETLKL